MQPHNWIMEPYNYEGFEKELKTFEKKRGGGGGGGGGVMTALWALKKRVVGVVSKFYVWAERGVCVCIFPSALTPGRKNRRIK